MGNQPKRLCLKNPEVVTVKKRNQHQIHTGNLPQKKILYFIKILYQQFFDEGFYIF